MSDSTKGSLVAQRTLAALMLFSERKHLLVVDVAAALNISLSSAYRIVESLDEMGFVKRDKSKRYFLNPPNILKLYSMVEQDIREIARPVMKEVLEKLKESIYLSVLVDDKSYVFIEKEDSPLQLKWSDKLGDVRPIPAGTAGKTHLAYMIKDMSDSERKAVLSQLELKPYTKNSITTVEELEKSLNKILEDGYCLTHSEHVYGVTGISVPVYNFKKETVVAILSVFMVESRYNDDLLDLYVSTLKEGASKISECIY